MDLKLFLDPLDPAFEPSNYGSDAIIHSVYLNRDTFPDIDGLHLAIVGIEDGRGAEEKHQEGLTLAANAIRSSFYGLSKGAGQLRIADLGNLRKGPELEDTYARIQEVGGYLMEQSILPVFIGGSHNMDFGQYMAYENLDKLVSLLGVDNKLDLDDPKSGIPSLSHFHRIIRHDPNFLFSFHQLGYQSYLVNAKHSDLMELLSFDATRLGLVKENVKELEPIIREADMLSFDVSAIQSHYCPGGTDVKVYGLSGEEACQICWYAGLNDKLSSAGFYGYDVNLDSDDRKTAFTLATMIWYFIEGFYHRKGDHDFRSNDYLIYEVAFEAEPQSIRFYKSKRSEKWWMEVPHPEDKIGFMRSKMVPCSYADYETALTGEIPEKWLNTFSKFT